MDNYAQGTIEYLVVMAVVIVIGLLVVGLMSSFFDSSSGISSSLNKINTKSGVISISDLVSDVDGDGVVGLRNNTGENLTITSVLVGGRGLCI